MFPSLKNRSYLDESSKCFFFLDEYVQTISVVFYLKEKAGDLSDNRCS